MQLSNLLFKSKIPYIEDLAKESNMSSILGRAAKSHIETVFNGWRSWTILKDLSFFSTVKNWVQYDNWDVSYFLYCICSLSMLMISSVLAKGNLKGLICHGVCSIVLIT